MWADPLESVFHCVLPTDEYSASEDTLGKYSRPPQFFLSHQESAHRTVGQQDEAAWAYLHGETPVQGAGAEGQLARPKSS